MVGTLDIDERASQVTQVEQVTNKDLSTCLFQFFRTRILSPHEGADKKPLPQKLQYGGRSVSAGRRGDENSWLGHCVFLRFGVYAVQANSSTGILRPPGAMR